MHTLLVGLALVMTANPAPQLAPSHACGKATKKTDAAKGSTPAVDPNVAVAKPHGGKVWILAGATPNVQGEELVKWLSSHPTATEITKKPSEERWPITFLAVFKRPPAKGRMTVEFVDKKEPGTLVDQYSPDTIATSVVFQEPYDLDTDNGFNKGHTYVIKVGQIIRNKFVSYATGEIALK
jgi:hypothetical protein